MEDGFPNFKIGIAGLGLIGGSIAKALKRAGYFVCGFDSDKSVIVDALKYDAIDKGEIQPDLLFDCDIVFVALYPDGIIEFVKNNALKFKKDSIVVDCCGIKKRVCESLYNTSVKGNFTFIGGHPMAGTEQNGFSASFAELFDGASFILTPRQDEDKSVLDKLTTVLKRAGFARVVITDPKHHDRMIAFTSQLPHILACSYVMSPSCPEHDGFSAGSFRDISRVAHINPHLWAQLFIDNRIELCAEIDIMMENMQKLRDIVKAADKTALIELLGKARRIKDNVDC